MKDSFLGLPLSRGTSFLAQDPAKRQAKLLDQACAFIYNPFKIPPKGGILNQKNN